MAERVTAGQYEVGNVEDSRDREPDSMMGVIQGSTANEKKYGGFSAFVGLSESKWYAYEQTEYLVQYADRSGTGVRMHTELEKEFDTKKDAVSYLERRYDL